MSMALTDRQRELADAGLGIVSAQGLAAVSFRSVASESGWSLGAVQKAFSSKDEILTAMFERIRERAVPMPAGEPGRPSLAAWLTDLFLLMMPLDGSGRAAYVQASAFAERAAFDPAVAESIAASDAEIQGRLASLVDRARAEGEVRRDLDAQAVARLYLDLAQGTAARLLYAPEPTAAVRRRAELAISALLA